MSNSYGGNKSLSLLYSGGSDSTLSAAILAEDFNEIHLITFKHYSTWNVRKSKINADKLRRKFKHVKFKHVFLNSSGLFLRFQGSILKDLFRHRYLTIFFCGVCKLAMHTLLILYNLKNNIKYAASGASHQMTMFPDQNAAGIQQLRQFYAEFGITLLNPVFDLVNTDKISFEMGLIEERHLKAKHKAKDIFEFFYVPIVNAVDNIQGFCLWIWLVDSYHWLVRNKELFSEDEIAIASKTYYKHKIESFCADFVRAKSGCK